jgi:iron complex outermembrane receptor protein
MKLTGVSQLAFAAGLIAGPMTGVAVAQTVQTTTEPEQVFVLGQLAVTARDSAGEQLGGSTIDAETMRTFNRQSVDDAIDLIPGANASNTGGSRNERLIFVRGFDRFQTTLSIDGVRVFLPADNRIDFGRFLTADLAEVQVSKGYVSVLDGPGGLGGAVNLVTRKPVKALEAELAATATSDGDLNYNSNTISGLVGMKRDLFYVQASGATTDRDSWSLSEDFRPTTLEDGGERVNSASSDWRVNLKAGFTPNATDEYAISYIRQSGEKNAPYHVTDTANTRFWSWPYWDIESVYFLSRTKLSDALTLKSRVYHNTFDNLLESFDNAAQTVQSLPRAFKSYYDDTAYGANVELDWALAPTNTLNAAFHYRKDEHNERQYGFTRTPATGNPFANRPYIEPWQKTEEDTYSFALEDTQKLGPDVDLIVGASYDWTDLKEAADVNVSVTGTTIANSVINFLPVVYPTKDMNALNGQAALAWRVTEDARLHASVSSRTRFPTLFERFSSRFGTAVPNPDIEPERSTNYEIGGQIDLPAGVGLEGAVFYSDLQDALVAVPVAFPAPIGNVSQTRNAASGEYYGAEIAMTAQVTDWLDVGGNATWIEREFNDPNIPTFEAQGVPGQKIFLYADWSVLPSVRVTPSLEWNSDRWTVTSTAPIRYYETGDSILLNLTVDWEVSPNVSLLAGGKNLGDENYTLVDGFPKKGAISTCRCG